MEEYEEFVGKLQKRGSKPHRLRHCLGSRDAFHWVRKNKWKATNGKQCDKLLYSRIIHEVHKELVSLMLEGHLVEFPYQMGTLLINCVPAKVFFMDGEYKNNYKVDWKKTLRFLYEDREALEQHRRVKRIVPYIYRIRYYKRSAKYANRRFYSFRANRSFKKLMGSEVEKGRLHVEQTEY